MPNRFEQSAPPSIDKIYQGLPVGPFGVTPFIHCNRKEGRRLSLGKSGLWILQGGRRLLESFRSRRGHFGKASPAPTQTAYGRAA